MGRRRLRHVPLDPELASGTSLQLGWGPRKCSSRAPCLIWCPHNSQVLTLSPCRSCQTQRVDLRWLLPCVTLRQIHCICVPALLSVAYWTPHQLTLFLFLYWCWIPIYPQPCTMEVEGRLSTPSRIPPAADLPHGPTSPSASGPRDCASVLRWGTACLFYCRTCLLPTCSLPCNYHGRQQEAA